MTLVYSPRASSEFSSTSTLTLTLTTYYYYLPPHHLPYYYYYLRIDLAARLTGQHVEVVHGVEERLGLGLRVRV